MDILYYVMIAVGIASIALALYENAKRNGMDRTKAKITRIDVREEHTTDADGSDTIVKHHTVYVSYEVGNTVYNEKLPYYDFSMKQGADIRILYDPDDPKRIKEAKRTALIVLIVFGVVLITLGCVLMNVK